MVADIRAAVCAHFHVSGADLVSRKRRRSIARPRQVSMYLARKLIGRSYPEIARMHGAGDHTTAMYACRRIPALMAKDDNVAKSVEEIMAALTEHGWRRVA